MLKRLRISTKCASDGQCVGVDYLSSGVAIYDTKDLTRPPIQMNNASFTSLLDAVKSGELDFPSS
jgi:hypothetical protein